MNLFSFRNLRILILLILFAVAAIYTKGQMLQTTNWIEPMEVVIFPINGDGSAKTLKYIESLHHVDFRDIDTFTARYAKNYKLHLRKPTRTRLGDVVAESPPAPPNPGDSRLSTMLWSLKLRYWAWANTPDDESNYTRARIFVIYHQGKKNEALPHSLGLQKGLIGVVHAYAKDKQSRQNNIIIAHELLHTVGATDKYHLNNGLPVFPDGFAQPDRKPLYPQRKAEIMAGRLPIDPHRAAIPKSLKYVVVGEKTAKEIGWSD